MLKNIFQWFVYSSRNPQAISMTLKGLAAVLVMFGVESAIAEEFTSYTVQLIIDIGHLVATVITILGFGRKLVLTFGPKGI